MLVRDPSAALAELGRVREPNAPAVLFLRGMAQEELGRYQDAEAAYTALLAKQDVPSARLGLVRVHLLQGELGEARAALSKLDATKSSDPTVQVLRALLADGAKSREAARSAIATLPDSGPEASPFGLAAHATLSAEAGDAIAAKRAKAALDRLTVSDAEAELAAALLAKKAGSRGTALLLLRRLTGSAMQFGLAGRVALLAHELGDDHLAAEALKLLPEGDATVLGLRAVVLSSVGDPSAERIIRQALDQSEGRIAELDLRVLLCHQLLRTGRLHALEKEQALLLERFPEAPGAQLEHARYLLARGRAGDAISALEGKVGEASPAPMHEVLASAALRAGRRDLAEQELALVVRAHPGNVRALRTLAALQRERGALTQALDTLAAEVKRFPKSEPHRLLFASALRQAGKKKEAEQLLSEGAKQNPEATRLVSALARMQVARGDDVAAERTLLDGLAVAPAAVRLSAELAAFYTRRGEGKKAGPHYERVLQVSATNPILLNNAAMVYADDLGDSARAVELAEKAHALAPGQPAVKDTLAWALIKRGGDEDLKRAIALLEEALPLLGEPTVQYHLAVALSRVGQVDRARALLLAALAGSGDFDEAEDARQMLATRL